MVKKSVRHVRFLPVFALTVAAIAPVPMGTAMSAPMPAPMSPAVTSIVPVAGWTCGRASSCAEAVREWCGGYSRADGDGDGIPCENICRSKAEVNRIRSQIGC